MLFIPLTIDVIWLCGLMAVSFVTGFIVRNSQLKKAKGRIAELEREMVLSHAEILELQKDKLLLQGQLKGSSNIPVIPIITRDEKKADNKSAGKK
jgi:hypothetical protein